MNHDNPEINDETVDTSELTSVVNQKMREFTQVSKKESKRKKNLSKILPTKIKFFHQQFPRRRKTKFLNRTIEQKMFISITKKNRYKNKCDINFLPLSFLARNNRKFILAISSFSYNSL